MYRKGINKAEVCMKSILNTYFVKLHLLLSLHQITPLYA